MPGKLRGPGSEPGEGAAGGLAVDGEGSVGRGMGVSAKVKDVLGVLFAGAKQRRVGSRVAINVVDVELHTVAV